MTIVLPDYVSFMIYQHGFFEEEMTRALLHFLKPGMVFYDVGAHFGYCSLLADELVGTAGQVHAFEPTPSTFKMLQENLSAKPNARLNNLALFSREATVTIHDYGIFQPGHNSIYSGRGDEAHRAAVVQEVEARAVTLDSYVQDSGAAPSFVKIDVEGAEPDVLRGAEQTIAAHHPIISIEVADAGEDMVSSREVVTSLLSQGYDALEYADGRFAPHKVQDRYEYSNLFFVAK